MKRLVIYGAGGFGREVWSMTADQRRVVFCDCTLSGSLLGTRIIQPHEIAPSDDLFIAVADTAARKRFAERFAGANFLSVIAPTAVIAPDVEIGEGAFLCHFSHAAVSARIGKQLLCHVYAYIGHENVIGDFVTVGPRASLNGNVMVGDGAYIGCGAMVRPGLTIGAGAFIAMGAVVTRDVAPGATVVGNPARPLLKNLRQQRAA